MQNREFPDFRSPEVGKYVITHGKINGRATVDLITVTVFAQSNWQIEGHIFNTRPTVRRSQTLISRHFLTLIVICAKNYRLVSEKTIFCVASKVVMCYANYEQYCSVGKSEASFTQKCINLQDLITHVTCQQCWGFWKGRLFFTLVSKPMPRMCALTYEMSGDTATLTTGLS